ncbi:membrane integrity-associated transporter subunit PqiC [Pseudoalteromonas sp. SR44-5]|uniref:PqiC family protein n=1 Tax=Pseudoalteromonas sp. SR44-5 TaxID=2760934 RepID=UPI0015FEC976|nr:PqiC family protein [Pseudoalteromonas sp. SR44-5]MBB1367575.1 membrane integrity-associated transporter subunit PqiC [Pseudoalteromonas sp. SR44-5]
MRTFLRIQFFAVIGVVLLSGCSQSLNAPVKYYQFEQSIKPMQRSSTNTSAQLRINTVSLRGALNNRGIAMKMDNNQVNAANYHLWSEAPDQMLTASAHQTLFTTLDNWMVVKGLPVITDKDQQSYYELEYELHHFNGDSHGNADISGLWRLYYTSFEKGRSLKEIHYFSEVSPLIDDDYEGLVESLELNWHNINKQVATTLSSLSHE